MMNDLKIIGKFVIMIVPVLLNVATLTLLERKIMAAIQIRRGPNLIGFGILQPIADGLKLLIKEFILPLKANKFLFILAPMLFLTISFSTWSVIPLEFHVPSSLNHGILCFLSFSSLSVYGILLGGWASNSRYAFLGALRSASQMLSYELVLSLLVLLVCLMAQSLNLADIALSQVTIWYIIPLVPFFIMYLIAILAETNRTPFDLPEAEAELVSGYSVEYSSGPFAFYFIAEYCNIIIWSFVTAILFLGAWYFIISNGYAYYVLKALAVMIFFCWIRAALPRYRWDQLMLLAWRNFLPMVLIGVFFTLSALPSSASSISLMAFSPIFGPGGDDGDDGDDGSGISPISFDKNMLKKIKEKCKAEMEEVYAKYEKKLDEIIHSTDDIHEIKKLVLEAYKKLELEREQKKKKFELVYKRAGEMLEDSYLEIHRKILRKSYKELKELLLENGYGEQEAAPLALELSLAIFAGNINDALDKPEYQHLSNEEADEYYRYLLCAVLEDFDPEEE